MYRVTTPTHTFKLPFDTSTCAEIVVTYKQGATELTKHYQDGVLPPGMSLDDENVNIRLEQTETKAFKAGQHIYAQVRVLTTDNNALASQMFKLDANEVLNEEVLE